MPFSRNYRIRFDDVDGAGILYYPRYFHLCHQALEDVFDNGAPVTYPELIHGRRLGLPTVAIESSFTAPLEYGDTATVSLSVERIGTSSLVLRFALHRMADGAACMQARVTTVLTDLDKRKSVPFPADLRAFFENLETRSETRP